MNAPRLRSGLRVLCLSCFAAVAVSAVGRAQIGTAFTFQGQLQNGGTPQTGPCDFRFQLYDAATKPCFPPSPT